MARNRQKGTANDADRPIRLASRGPSEASLAGAFDWDPTRPLREQWPWNGAPDAGPTPPSQDAADAIVIESDALVIEGDAPEATEPTVAAMHEMFGDEDGQADASLEDDDAISDLDRSQAIEAQEPAPSAEEDPWSPPRAANMDATRNLCELCDGAIELGSSVCLMLDMYKHAECLDRIDAGAIPPEQSPGAVDARELACEREDCWVFGECAHPYDCPIDRGGGQ